MNRLLPTVLVVALAGVAALAYLRFQSESARRALQTQLVAESNRAQALSSDLAAAKQENTTLTAKVHTLEGDVSAVHGKLTASETRATQLERDLAQAKSAAALHEQNSRALAAEIATLRQDLADTRAAQASPEAIAAYRNTIAELERQLASAQNGAAAPSAAGAATAVFSSRGGRANVVNVGPGNAFVVLDFGAERGAQLGQRLTVNQGTDVVATVLISDVRPNFSIAQVLPETLRAVLQKGDPALLIRSP
jgi:septal ring factor EnvC (AmiA/AmiB activator)